MFKSFSGEKPMSLTLFPSPSTLKTQGNLGLPRNSFYNVICEIGKYKGFFKQRNMYCFIKERVAGIQGLWYVNDGILIINENH